MHKSSSHDIFSRCWLNSRVLDRGCPFNLEIVVESAYLF